MPDCVRMQLGCIGGVLLKYELAIGEQGNQRRLKHNKPGCDPLDGRLATSNELERVGVESDCKCEWHSWSG